MPISSVVHAILRHDVSFDEALVTKYLVLHCRSLAWEVWTFWSTTPEPATRQPTPTTTTRMPLPTSCGLTRCRWLQLTTQLQMPCLPARWGCKVARSRDHKSAVCVVAWLKGPFRGKKCSLATCVRWENSVVVAGCGCTRTCRPGGRILTA